MVDAHGKPLCAVSLKIDPFASEGLGNYILLPVSAQYGIFLLKYLFVQWFLGRSFRDPGGGPI